MGSAFGLRRVGGGPLRGAARGAYCGCRTCRTCPAKGAVVTVEVTTDKTRWLCEPCAGGTHVAPA